MTKSLYIAEKPSVAQEFAKALKENMQRKDGYLESQNYVVTWCVGHLVTMSYPEKYNPDYRRWSFDTLPFLPKEFLYEIIPGVEKQFRIVSGLLNRKDVDTIYVCTDSGREGEYIYRLVAQMAGVGDKKQKRVWIDSQTEEEILRGIREAKDEKEYDNLSASAYLRAKEDYLMGINFSRALTLKYGNTIANYLGTKYQAVSVGRVMTCVLGMVVRREREIRTFVKTPFYRVLAALEADGHRFDAEWKAVSGSRYFESPLLYKENGFRKKEDAERLTEELRRAEPQTAVVEKASRKKENKNPPLLYNLAELQNDCAKLFRISPDETLKVVQELYEKKLVTYPRTDARVLSSAVAKEIHRNLSGLKNYEKTAGFAAEILENGSYRKIGSTRYTNDKQITDHYAIIPTGQGLGNLKSLRELSGRVYEVIARRFLAVFYPPAVYQKVALETAAGTEHFFAGFRVLMDEGYLKVMKYSFSAKKGRSAGGGEDGDGKQTKTPEGKELSEDSSGDGGEIACDRSFLEAILKLRKGSVLPIRDYQIKEGETAPPKRYTSGSMILAMENAGQLIEDEELRAQIKGSGIGTSATRAEILKKLFAIHYLSLNKKTQVITPTQLGEMIFDVVSQSIRSLLNPELTASWEKGLTYVAEGSITPEEYMTKLEQFVARHTENVKRMHPSYGVRQCFEAYADVYKKGGGREKAGEKKAKGEKRS